MKKSVKIPIEKLTKNLTAKLILRIVSLMLAALLLLFAVGCDKLSREDMSVTDDPAASGGEERPTENDGTNPDQREPLFTPADMIELDFEGAQISIMYCDTSGCSRDWYHTYPQDELEEAIVERNSKVMEELNLNISWAPVRYSEEYNEYSARLNDMVISDVNSGRHYYDVCSSPVKYSSSLALRDYTANLLDKTVFPYFDFSLKCWNQSIVNGTSANGRLHYAAGAINVSLYDATYVVWFNKTLYDAHKLEGDPENIQQYALDGKWTYDELYKWTNRLYVDDDHYPNEVTRSDTFALAMNSDNGVVEANQAFIYAWDLDFVIENEDKTHSFNLYNNDKAEAAIEKCLDLFNAVGTYIDDNCDGSFVWGSKLFYIGEMFTSRYDNEGIRKMDDRYGILPMPKYSVDQPQYYTTATDRFNLMFAIDHSKSKIGTQGAMISAFLQLSAEEAVTGTTGYYFNRVIKPKRFVDDQDDEKLAESSMLLNNNIAIYLIIIENTVFDYANIYSSSLSDVNSLWQDALHSPYPKTLGLAYSNKSDLYEEALKDLDKWFGIE